MSRLASKWSGLPAEIWDVCLLQLDPADRQHTALALSRALPATGASAVHLFTHTRITHDSQAVLLYHRLGSRRSDADELRGAIRSFSCESWRPDPDLVVNLITTVPRLLDLHLRVGPLWSPEPFEDLFFKPYHAIRRIDLRFNPYVKQKTYYTFLKGAYYDVALEKLAKWPSLPAFTTFSFVQDVTPDLPAQEGEGPSESLVPSSFAQPLVLFKTFCISSFASSNAGQHIKYLRFRIPHRSILAALTSTSTSTTVQPSDEFCRPLPSLELLDISTSFVPLGPALRALLLRHAGLQHLILDRCGLSGVDAFQALGAMAASIGVLRAKEAHRAWRALLMKRRDLEATSAVQQQQPSSSSAQPARTRRTGRSGLSEAAPAIRRREAAAAEAARAAAAPSASLDRYASLPLVCYVLPSYSSLRSICAGSGRARWDRNPNNVEAFSEGWEEGLERVEEMLADQLKSFKRPFTQGSLNGRKVLCRFAEAGEALPVETGEGVWEDLKRTWRLIECDPADLAMSEPSSECVLCCTPDCSGDGSVAWSDGGAQPVVDTWRPADVSQHVAGCGHLLARRIFDQPL